MNRFPLAGIESAARGVALNSHDYMRVMGPLLVGRGLHVDVQLDGLPLPFGLDEIEFVDDVVRTSIEITPTIRPAVAASLQRWWR